jgi:hypothetical protein
MAITNALWVFYGVPESLPEERRASRLDYTRLNPVSALIMGYG